MLIKIIIFLFIILFFYCFNDMVRIGKECEKEIKKRCNMSQTTPLPDDYNVMEGILVHLKYSKPQNAEKLFDLANRLHNSTNMVMGLLLLTVFLLAPFSFFTYELLKSNESLYNSQKKQFCEYRNGIKNIIKNNTDYDNFIDYDSKFDEIESECEY